jgi:hypothetical protein
MIDTEIHGPTYIYMINTHQDINMEIHIIPQTCYCLSKRIQIVEVSMHNVVVEKLNTKR